MARRKKRTNVVRFNTAEAQFRARLKAARKAAKTDGTIRKAFEWWCDRYSQEHWKYPGSYPDEPHTRLEWVKETPPPTTLEEAEQTLDRFHADSHVAWLAVRECMDEQQAKVDAIIRGD